MEILKILGQILILISMLVVLSNKSSQAYESIEVYYETKLKELIALFVPGLALIFISYI